MHKFTSISSRPSLDHRSLGGFSLGCILVTTSWEKWSFPLSATVRPLWDVTSSTGVSSTGEIFTFWTELGEWPPRWFRGMMEEGRQREMSLLMLEEKTLTKCPYYSLCFPEQGVQGRWSQILLKVHSSRIKAKDTRSSIGKQLDRKKIFLPWKYKCPGSCGMSFPSL